MQRSRDPGHLSFGVAWETVFKPFTMKICEVIWIFANYL
jgi:hypothetical protein